VAKGVKTVTSGKVFSVYRIIGEVGEKPFLPQAGRKLDTDNKYG